MNNDAILKRPKTIISVIIAGALICFLLTRFLAIPGFFLAFMVIAVSSIIFGGLAGGAVGFTGIFLTIISYDGQSSYAFSFLVIPAVLYGILLGPNCRGFISKTNEKSLVKNTVYIFMTSLFLLLIITFFFRVIFADYFSRSGVFRYLIRDLYYTIKDITMPGIIISIPASLSIFIYLKLKMKKQAAPVNEESEAAEQKPEDVSKFDGDLLSYIVLYIIGTFITLFTLGLCFPWAACLIYQWETDSTAINGRKLKFSGKARKLFNHWVLWYFLCIITLGIYIFRTGAALEKWKIENTSFADTDTESDYEGSLSSLAGRSILCALVTVLTLGICCPFVLCMFYKHKINNTVINGQRLKFTGKARELFVYWIPWLLLSIITFGIYSFRAYVNLEEWKVRNTSFAD